MSGAWEPSAADGVEVRRLGALAREAGLPALAEEGARLAERASAGSYYVACLGQFKRGKSSLLNALLGKPLLPTGVLPVTSVATIVRFGPSSRARVRLAEGWREIQVEAVAEYVTEAHNPGNRKGVLAVEVFEPAPLLARGMCLVDTPGIGSVYFDNSEATREFVPQVDAALVTLGADPPISGDELVLIQQVAEQVDCFVFVLNKADRLEAADFRQARHFTLQVLQRALQGEPVDIFEISARERLAGEKTRDWVALEVRLAQLALTAGDELAAQGVRRGLERLRQRLLASLEERRLALTSPLEQSEARVARLASLVTEAEQSLSQLGHFFRAEEERLGQALEAQRQRFLEHAVPGARAALATRLATTHGRPSTLRRQSQEMAEAVARSWIDVWVAEEAATSQRLYRDATARLVTAADGFLSRCATQPGLEALGAPLDLDLRLRVHGHRYFTDLLYALTVTPLAWTLDQALPRCARMPSIARQASRYLERLLEANSSRVQFDLDERVRVSGRRLESELRARLGEAVSMADAALEFARGAASAGQVAVEAELKQLESLRRRAQPTRSTSPA
ncbi:MAG: dynamin family protein [Myxococcaceae bacterium]